MTDFELNIQTDGSTTFHWGRLDQLLISFSLPGAIPDERFEEYLGVIRKYHVRYLLAFAEGAATINSVQRKRAADLTRENELRIAVILDSPITRGLLRRQQAGLSAALDKRICLC